MRTARPIAFDQQALRNLAFWRYREGLPMRHALALVRRGEPGYVLAGEVALRRTQAGIEAVGARGTAVAATRRVYGSGSIRRRQNPIRPSDEDRSSFLGRYRSTPGLIFASLPWRATATYEDLPWWLRLAIKRVTAPVVVNTAGQKWDFIPTLTSNDLDSGTFENGDDTQAWQMAFGMVTRITIRGALGEPWALELELVGKDMVPVAFTAAIGDRDVEDIETHLTRLAIGAAGAVPSGFLTGRVIGFSFTLDNRLSPQHFMDAAATPTIGKVGRGKWDATLEVTWEGNAATVTERATWLAGTARVVRLQANGIAIAGATGGQTKQAEIIVAGKYADWELGERETNTIFTSRIEAQYDSALGLAIQLFVINALAALP